MGVFVGVVNFEKGFFSGGLLRGAGWLFFRGGDEGVWGVDCVEGREPQWAWERWFGWGGGGGWGGLGGSRGRWRGGEGRRKVGVFFLVGGEAEKSCWGVEEGKAVFWVGGVLVGRRGGGGGGKEGFPIWNDWGGLVRKGNVIRRGGGFGWFFGATDCGILGVFGGGGGWGGGGGRGGEGEWGVGGRGGFWGGGVTGRGGSFGS